MNFVERSEHLFKALGLRNTRTRRQVAEVMDQQERPFSAKDIHESLIADEKASMEFSTVYRTLETYAELGLIHPVLVHGQFVVCRAREKSEPLVHVLYHCRKCETVEEDTIESGKAAEVVSLLRQKEHRTFETEGATVDLFGSCSSCAGGNS